MSTGPLRRARTCSWSAHESLGRVVTAPPDSGLAASDLVVGIVRRPDPVPCAACAAGAWDMCRNGRYTERGIKGLHGYGAEQWRVEAEYAVPVDPALGFLAVLLEPASVVAKAWDHLERIVARAPISPHRVLVTGAGPSGCWPPCSPRNVASRSTCSIV